MGEFSVWHWLIVAVVVLVLFGSKRLPDAARSVGRSLRILKSEIREFGDDRADAGPSRPPVIEGGTDSATPSGAAGGRAAEEADRSPGAEAPPRTPVD